MPKQCPDCMSFYPNFVDYCVADGLRLNQVIDSDPDEEESANTFLHLGSLSQLELLACQQRRRTAYLFPKESGAIAKRGIRITGDVILGIFDPAVGTVDVDLSAHRESTTISSRHARLSERDGMWYVEDLGSAHGIFIDRDLRVATRTTLKPGQELALGNAQFIFWPAGAEAEEFCEDNEIN